MSELRALVATGGPPAALCLCGAAAAAVSGATWPAVAGLAALWVVVPLEARVGGESDG